MALTLTFTAEVEELLRRRSEAEGLTVEAYIEQIARRGESILQEIETAVLEGIESGEPFEPDDDFWEERHRRLDEHFKKDK